jgi:hypothetical protein
MAGFFSSCDLLESVTPVAIEVSELRRATGRTCKPLGLGATDLLSDFTRAAWD